jgi:L-lactate permease
LAHTINFATGTQNNSSTATDDIFVDSTRLISSSTSLIINGVSGHEGQLIAVNNIVATAALIPLKQRTGKTDNETVMHFQLLLRNEMWESVYKS